MDENHQDKTGNKQLTSEIKLWLPPSFVKDEVSVGQELAQRNEQKRRTKANNERIGFSSKGSPYETR